MVETEGNNNQVMRKFCAAVNMNSVLSDTVHQANHLTLRETVYNKLATGCSLLMASV